MLAPSWARQKYLNERTESLQSSERAVCANFRLTHRNKIDYLVGEHFRAMGSGVALTSTVRNSRCRSSVKR